MIIYIDSLVFINIIIDYILLILTGLIVKRNYNLKRIIIASVFGGLASLYILVDGTPVIIDIIFKIISGSLVLLLSQRFRRFKDFAISFSVFMFLSFMLLGSVEFVSSHFSSEILVSNNLMNYISISPLSIILVTLVIYFIIVLVKRCFERNVMVEYVDLNISLCGSVLKFKAMVDSGHNLNDPFSNSQVFILNSEQYNEIKTKINKKELNRRERLIPANTVGSTELLEGIRCDSADIINNSNKYCFNSPIIVSSAIPLKCETEAIVSSLVFKRLND